MPLLRKTPFRRVEAPKDVKPGDYVFVCDSTKEAFKDYEEFFKRTILCNSLVWSCSLTNKTGLTFEEALECEKKAKERLGVLPKELKMGLLMIGHHTRRGRLSDLVDDVYKFALGRFFLGEKIEAVIGDLWCESIVKEVIPPSIEQVTHFLQNNNMDDKTKKKSSFEPHESLFKYKVLETDPDDPLNNPIVTVDADDVRREKYSFSRDKVLLFLKNASEFASNGNFKLKASMVSKYSVASIEFSQVFSGPLPVFEETTRLKGTASALGKKTKQSSMDQFIKGGEPKVKKSPAQIEADMKKMREQNERFKEEMRQRAEDAKKRKLEEKAREKERKKEEKKLLGELLAESSKPREDLLCEDHRELPHPKPVHCRLPNHLFGDFLMLLEFFNGFSEVLETRDTFPQGVTFDLLESALCTADSMSSELTDILSFTLGALFDLQKEEEEEVKLNKATAFTQDIDKSVLGKREDVASHIRSATLAAQWPNKTQGTDLRDIHLDKWSITEVLRIHLESAGAYFGDRLGTWRFQQRGGYRLLDDPGLYFRMDQPQILESLSKVTVFELSIQDKLRILTCLADQILSFATVRDEIDERFNLLSESKAELRNHQLTENRRLKQIEESKKAKRKEETAQAPPAQQSSSSSSTEMTTRQKEIIQAQKDKEERSRLDKEESIRTEASLTEKELLNRVSELHSKAVMTCLGRDRAYRRFWVLDTLPAIFVEDEDEFVGPCLGEPTPYNPNAEPLSEAKALEQAKEILNAREKQGGGANSDKENKIKNSSSCLKSSSNGRKSSQQQKVLGAKNGSGAAVENGGGSVAAESNGTEEAADNSVVKTEEEGGRPFGLCLADMENCPVHSTILPRTRWSFYSTPEELENLIGALNPRGLREKELRARLLREKTVLTTSLKKFNLSSKLIQNDKVISSEGDDGCIMNIVDITLRDQVLDLEEKIFFGTLGTLKVDSRVKWQHALQQGGYDRQCESLKWNGSQEGGRSPTNAEGETSASSAPASKKIKDLSSALLQIGRMVDEKYLKEPLCESEKGKKKRLKEEKEREDDENGMGASSSSSSDLLTPKQLWEGSLMNCTSYAQLFIHLNTLENSIIWSKSIMNTRCRICRRKSDPENMLLCDGCDRGHHMKCLKPPLKSVPVGDWFCSECKPKQIRIRSPKKTRRVFVTNEDEDNNEDSEDAAGDQTDGSDEENSNGEDNDNGESEEETLHEEDASEKDSPRQRKAKKNKNSKKSSPEAPPLPTKKRRTITQLLGKRRCATEASEKIHQSAAQESSSGNSSSTENESRSGERRSKRRNLESLLSSSNLAAAEVSSSTSSSSSSSKKRSRKSQEEDYSPTVLEDLLNSMMKHSDGWPFDRPITKADAPDYHKIIKKPMDLGTIRSNLNRMKYASNESVIQDIKLVFDNCFCYNREEAEEYGCGVRLEAFFNKEIERLGFAPANSSEEKRPSKRGRRTL